MAPGISNVVHVDELYYHVSNKMRLMKVEIPEYCLYNLHDMMVILTHETAHYVGREYRLRGDVRYVSILKNFSHIYVSYVRGWCIEEKVCECKVKNSWEIAEKRMESILNKALQRKIDVNYVSKVENEEIGMDLGHVVDNNKLYGKHKVFVNSVF